MASFTQPLHPDPADIRHESEKSLEVYQHLLLESVDKAYPRCGSDRRHLMVGITYLCWNLTKLLNLGPDDKIARRGRHPPKTPNPNPKTARKYNELNS